MNTIKFQGNSWRLHKSSPGRLIFLIVNEQSGKMLAWRKARGLNQREAAAALGVS